MAFDFTKNIHNIDTDLAAFPDPHTIDANWENEAQKINGTIHTTKQLPVIHDVNNKDWSKHTDIYAHYNSVVANNRYTDTENGTLKFKPIKYLASELANFTMPLTAYVLSGAEYGGAWNDGNNYDHVTVEVFLNNGSNYKLTNLCDPNKNEYLKSGGIFSGNSQPNAETVMKSLNKGFRIKVEAIGNADLRDVEIQLPYKFDYKFSDNGHGIDISFEACLEKVIIDLEYPIFDKKFIKWVKYDKPFKPDPISYTSPAFVKDDSFPGHEPPTSKSVSNIVRHYIAVYNEKYYVSYFIKFNKKMSAATGTMANQQMFFECPAWLTANGFSSIDYRFIGWALTSDGTAKYKNKELITNTKSTQLTPTSGATVDLWARWQYYIEVDLTDKNLVWTTKGKKAGNQVSDNTYGAHWDVFPGFKISKYIKDSALVNSAKEHLKVGKNVTLKINFKVTIKKFQNKHTFAHMSNHVVEVETYGHKNGTYANYVRGEPEQGWDLKTKEGEYEKNCSLYFVPDSHKYVDDYPATCMFDSEFHFRIDYGVINHNSDISDCDNLAKVQMTSFVIYGAKPPTEW